MLDGIAKSTMEQDEYGDKNEEADEEYQPLVVATKGAIRPATFEGDETGRRCHTKIASCCNLLFLVLLLVVVQSIKIVSIQLTTSSSTAEHSYATDHRWPQLQMLEHLHGTAVEGSQKKRLVVVAANAAYVYFADNFASSLLQLNVTNFVIVPLDEKAFGLLQSAYPMHTLPPPPIAESSVVPTSAIFGTKAFQALTSSRPTILRYFLEKNITVFYNDVDVVWRRNAWYELDRLDTTGTKLKIWEDGDDDLCSCLLYLPATDFTLNFLREWESEILSQRHNNDQPALGAAAVTLGIDRLWRSKEDSSDVQIFPHSDEFPNGRDFFELGSNQSRSRAVIIHNNWIRGQLAKRERFKRNGLWHLSGRLPEEKDSPPVSSMRAKVLRNWSATVSRNVDHGVKNKTAETGN